MKPYLTEKGLPTITNKEIKQIGIDFFRDTKADKETMDVATMMMNYKEEGNVLVKWLHLFNYYHKLSPNNKLRGKIEETIETAFDDDVSNVIRNITFERGIPQLYLFFIGSEYLKLFPKEEKGFWGFDFGGHTNQSAAEKLIESSTKYLGRQSWINLYLIYKKLPKNNGTLAKSIQNLFKAHFNNEDFEETVKALELDNAKESDLKTPDALNEAFTLPKEAEEQFIRLRAEQLFRKQDVKLNLFEDLSIFWVKRSPYFKMVTTSGTTVLVPVMAGLFLTSNVYALIALGVGLGLGSLVVEIVGSTALKIEDIPDGAMEKLKSNFIASELSSREISKAANEISGQLSHLRDISEKQTGQLVTLTTENSKLKGQVETLDKVAKSFLATGGEHKALTEKLTELTNGSSDAAAKLLLAESEFKKENDVLKQKVEDLTTQINRLEKHDQQMLSSIQHLQGIISQTEGTKSDLTDAIGCLLETAGVQFTRQITYGSETPSELVKKAEELLDLDPKDTAIYAH